jgi:hypothetical protein
MLNRVSTGRSHKLKFPAVETSSGGLEFGSGKFLHRHRLF